MLLKSTKFGIVVGIFFVLIIGYGMWNAFTLQMNQYCISLFSSIEKDQTHDSNLTKTGKDFDTAITIIQQLIENNGTYTHQISDFKNNCMIEWRSDSL